MEAPDWLVKCHYCLAGDFFQSVWSFPNFIFDEKTQETNKHVGILLLLTGIARLKEWTQPFTKRYKVAQLKMWGKNVTVRSHGNISTIKSDLWSLLPWDTSGDNQRICLWWQKERASNTVKRDRKRKSEEEISKNKKKLPNCHWNSSSKTSGHILRCINIWHSKLSIIRKYILSCWNYICVEVDKG